MLEEHYGGEDDDASAGGAGRRTGKYLTFRLGDEDYGLEILKVREIIAFMDITPMPLTPEFVRGIINLRGKVIPVIDLRAKFCMAASEDHDRKCIIVVDVIKDGHPVQMSILVDTVSEVQQIAGKDIDDPPAFGAGVSIDYILGVAKSPNGVKILLHIDNILQAIDVVKISGMAGAPADAPADAPA